MQTSQALLWAVVLLSGCAPSGGASTGATFRPKVQAWDRSNTTQDQFMRDRYDCILQARQQSSSAAVSGYVGLANSGTTINAGILRSCLGAKGYIPSDYGQFVAPPGTEVWTN